METPRGDESGQMRVPFTPLAGDQTVLSVSHNGATIPLEEPVELHAGQEAVLVLDWRTPYGVAGLIAGRQFTPVADSNPRVAALTREIRAELEQGPSETDQGIADLAAAVLESSGRPLGMAPESAQRAAVKLAGYLLTEGIVALVRPTGSKAREIAMKRGGAPEPPWCGGPDDPGHPLNGAQAVAGIASGVYEWMLEIAQTHFDEHVSGPQDPMAPMAAAWTQLFETLRDDGVIAFPEPESRAAITARLPGSDPREAGLESTDEFPCVVRRRDGMYFMDAGPDGPPGHVYWVSEPAKATRYNGRMAAAAVAVEQTGADRESICMAVPLETAEGEGS